MRGKTIQALQKSTRRLASWPGKKIARAEEQIIKLTLIYWQRQGRCHQNAWSAWQQAERELMLRFRPAERLEFI